MSQPMTEQHNNPWSTLNLSSSRRVELETVHDFFWILDDQGRMGLKTSFRELPHEASPIEKISGMAVVLRHSDRQTDELFLIITNPADREIFYSLCLDLIRSTQEASGDRQLYYTILNRLRHWRRFLSETAAKTLSEQLQMGLYAELLFLKETALTVLTPEAALHSWVGPDFDKQDFSFDGCLAEIKAFITSKGPFVKISSMHQLFFDEKPLYLTAFGLSRVSAGTSIITLIAEIQESLPGEIENDLFDQKLAQYGYFQGITEAPFFNYAADSRRIYKITEDFPRIVPNQISKEIVTVQYSIDLSKCRAHAVPEVPIINT